MTAWRGRADGKDTPCAAAAAWAGEKSAPAVIEAADLLPTPTLRTLRADGRDARVRLRAGRRGDAVSWSRLRREGEEYFRSWEPEAAEPWAQRYGTSRWRRAERENRLALRAGRAVPAVIEADGRFAGQMTLGGIIRGPNQSAWVGYWVAESVRNRGVATAALALAVTAGCELLGLQRLEATVRPENRASRAVLAAVGFREEGLLRGYLQVDGQRRDHLLYGLVRADLPQGAVARLIAEGAVRWECA